MLKIVGTEDGIVKDEKILITDEGKLTKFGIALIVIELLADIGVFLIIRSIMKLGKKLKKLKEMED